MNHIKSICKDPAKLQQKIQGRQFLLGKYFDLKNKCHRCKKDKKFIKSKRQKLLEIQQKITEEKRVNSQGLGEKIVDQKNQLQKNQELKKLKSQKANTRVNYSYNYFIPLNKLWNSYMHDLLCFQQVFSHLNRKNEQAASLKILKSDFVGAQIQIVYSKIQSYIGHKGIVIKQTLKTFIIIKKLQQYSQPQNSTKQINNKIIIQQKNQAQNNYLNDKPTQNNTICLLKNQIIFKIQADQKQYLINGNTLGYRPSDRTKHKFKFKIGQNINLQFLQHFTKQDD